MSDESPNETSSDFGRLGPDTKIFGVGLNKTGTSSLKKAWELLGIGPIPSPKIVAKARIIDAALWRDDFEPALAFAEEYRGMEDRPWNVGDMYRRLVERFDDSLFILTVRDEESWWRSVHRWITVVKPTAQARYLKHFQVDEFSQEAFLAAYRRYNAEVTAYFEATHPERFLVMNVGGGDEWESLCGFFECAIPPVPFPHANRQRYQDKKPGDPSDEAPSDRLRLTRCPTCEKALAPPEVQSDDPSSWSYRVEARWSEARVRTILRDEKRRRRKHKTLSEVHAAHPGLTLDDFGVVSCYFNPLGSRRRLSNYRKFATALGRAGIPLMTTELAFGDRPHHLTGDWGDVIEVRSDAVMWHKERLLNIAIEKMLERGFRKIAWLDADIEFLDDQWAWRVAAELERSNVCQVFSDVLVGKKKAALPKRGVSAIRYYQERGQLLPQGRAPRRFSFLPTYPGGFSGYGWAARAEVLEKVELYEGAVIGGGDKLIYLASYLREDSAMPAIDSWFESTNPVCPRCGHSSVAARWHAHYLDWAKRWCDAVDGKIGYAEGVLRDFYHGKRRNRQYHARKEILFRRDFDPAVDLRLNADGCLEWASDKPALHADLQAYFDKRSDH